MRLRSGEQYSVIDLDVGACLQLCDYDNAAYAYVDVIDSLRSWIGEPNASAMPPAWADVDDNFKESAWYTTGQVRHSTAFDSRLPSLAVVIITWASQTGHGCLDIDRSSYRTSLQPVRTSNP